MNWIYNNPHIRIMVIQKHDEGDRVRRHKKKRIDKKYLKKYGVYGPQRLKKGEVLFYGDCAYMSRQTFNEVKLRLKENKNEKSIY